MARSPKTIALGGMFAIALVSLQARQLQTILAHSHPQQLTSGAVAPAIEFDAADGTPIHQSEFGGHPVVVSFWAAWCAPCRKELPEVAEMIDAWNAKAPATERVFLVAVNQGDEPSSISMFVEDRRLRSARFTFDPDGVDAERWKVRALPTTFFVDRKGVIRDRQEGYRTGFSLELEKRLRDESRTAALP